MKASNPVVMIQGYRLLAAEMRGLGWDYPLHLGVTEAGEGEDGRMKSAIGIGTLLGDGLGDTIRVSLTEDPEYEYGPCNRLAELAGEQLEAKAREEQAAVPKFMDSRDVTTFDRRRGSLPEQRDDDVYDYRGLLHRDGSAYGAVSLAELQGCAALGGLGDAALFRALGALVDELPPGPDGVPKLLPRRDVATVDAILLREAPSADDADTLYPNQAAAGRGRALPYGQRRAEECAGTVAERRRADRALRLFTESRAGAVEAVSRKMRRERVGRDARRADGHVQHRRGVTGREGGALAVARVAAALRFVTAGGVGSKRGAPPARAAGHEEGRVSTFLRHARRRTARRRPRRRVAGRAGRPRRLRPELFAGDVLRAAAGVAHAQHEDGVRVLSLVRPDVI